MPQTWSNPSSISSFTDNEQGLSPAEAAARLRRYGPNILKNSAHNGAWREFLTKLVNPLNVMLGVIGVISWRIGEIFDACIVLGIIAVTVGLSFIQEDRSVRQARRLSGTFKPRASVIRGGAEMKIPASELVPGDVTVLRAGDLVLADLTIFRAKDFHVNEAALTGESLPVEKCAGRPHEPQDLQARVYAGSSVVSGSAWAFVTQTGAKTRFGDMAARLSEAPIETAFDREINRFIRLMIGFTAALVIFIFFANVGVKGRPVEALRFSLAVAVGLTPEMLPVVMAITLSAGCIALSRKKVIVKHLNAIQNLGTMDVLCSDKTGTLTENRIVLERHCDVAGNESEEVLRLAYWNSYFQTGLRNLLDEAVLKNAAGEGPPFSKFDEIPFDFERRMMSVVIDDAGKHRLITKGAPETVFRNCAYYAIDDEVNDLSALVLADLKEEYEKLSAQGFRVLALATKELVEKKEAYSKSDESEMVLRGYLAFLDPPRHDSREVIGRLERLGVRTLVLSGDDEWITKKICGEVGLKCGQAVTGIMLETMTESEISGLVQKQSVFARLSPHQKEKIVSHLRDLGHTVGFLGDGINDALALKAADIGISVSSAADIAKESADILLLEKSLIVLERGILEGRKISGNVMKYLKMASSSNLGNMISMTAASVFLPFLPMTPIQILFNNMLYDLSQMAIPADRVEKEYILKPRPWDVQGLKKFMLIFGTLSSAFDFLTFGIMVGVLRLTEHAFQTGWFLESLATQTLVIYVIRSRRIPFLQTMPSPLLILTTSMALCLGFGLTILPAGTSLGFTSLPPAYYWILCLIVGAYLFCVECVQQRRQGREESFR